MPGDAEMTIATTIDQVWNDERAWTNFAQTAGLLQIDRSTLTKQAQRGRVDFVVRGMGRGERLVPTVETVRLAHIYRRVPTDKVLDNLASWIAERVLLRVDDILTGLRELADVAVNETDEAAPPRVADGERRESGHPRIVPLGRLRPQQMRVDDFPAPGLAEALASRRLAERRVRVIEREPKVVQLGRLRPGGRP